MGFKTPPCHLVLVTRRALAIVMVSFLHKSRSSTASLSSAKLIPDDIVSISSIHLFIGRFLLPSPYASIISFSIPFALITCQRTSTVLLPFVSATYLLLHVRSPSVLIRLFSSQSRRPSTSFSISAFQHQFSFPLLLSLSMSHNHRVSPER